MPAIKDVGAQVVTGIIIGLFGVSIGFGSSQIMAVTQVREMAVEIKALHESDKDISQRVDRLSMHLDELIKQNTELIMLLKVQNGAGNGRP